MIEQQLALGDLADLIRAAAARGESFPRRLNLDQLTTHAHL